MEFVNGGAQSALRGGRMAKGALAALLALFLVALMAGPAEAGTPAYSLSVKYAEGGSTPLYHAVGLATDSGGNVYVLSSPVGKPATVQKFSPSGSYLAKFGTSSGVGALQEPVGVDVDSSGNVWVACRGSSKLVEFAPGGSVLKEISTAVGRPVGVAADGLGGVWYPIGDEGPGSAWKIAANGSYVAGFGSLNNVHSIDVDAGGNVWVGQDVEKRVQEYSSNGTFIRSWNPAGGYPRGLAADVSGNLWIGHGTEVRKYSPLGVQLDKFGSYGPGAGHFLGMSRYDGVAVGPEGAVWVINEPANEVQKWVPTP